MIGGYSDDDPDEVNQLFPYSAGQHLPAISCGFHPGLADAVTAEIGTDYLANVGGVVHGHPEGTKAGALAMRQALSGITNRNTNRLLEVGFRIMLLV